MIKITYDISKLEKRLNKLVNDIDEASKNTIKDNIPKIRDCAKDLCPVDSGDLRDSITDRYEDEAHCPSGEVYTNKDYAHFVEFGTVKRAPQPYMYPAYKEYEDFIMQYLINSINKSIE